MELNICTSKPPSTEDAQPVLMNKNANSTTATVAGAHAAAAAVVLRKQRKKKKVESGISMVDSEEYIWENIFKPKPEEDCSDMDEAELEIEIFKRFVLMHETMPV